MPISDTDQHTPFINIFADGVTSIDTFNTWRKKTNGIIKVINDGLITRYIADRAITPSKLSEGGPYWDHDGTFNTNGNNTRFGYARGGNINAYIGHTRVSDGASALIFRTATSTGVGTDTASITRGSGLNSELTIYNKSAAIRLAVDTANKISFLVNSIESANIDGNGLNVTNSLRAKNVLLSDATPYYRLTSTSSGSASWNIESGASKLYVRRGTLAVSNTDIIPLQIFNNDTIVVGGAFNYLPKSTDELTVVGESLFTSTLRANSNIVAGHGIGATEAIVDVGAGRIASGNSAIKLYTASSIGTGSSTDPTSTIIRDSSGNLTFSNFGAGKTVFSQGENGSYEFKINNSLRLNIDKNGKVTIPGTLEVTGGFVSTNIPSSDSAIQLINAVGDYAPKQTYFKLGTSIPEDYYLIVGGNRGADDSTNIVLRSHSGNWTPTSNTATYNTDGLHIYKASGLSGHAGISNSGTGSNFTLENKATGNIILRTNSINRLVVRGDTGNIGIGLGINDIPSSRLHVSGTVTATAFSGPLTGDVTGKATTSGTADISIVLETPNIKITGDTVLSNGTLKLAHSGKTADTATAIDTIIYDGRKGIVATFDGSEKSLKVEGNLTLAADKKIVIPQISTANRRAVIQTGDWYFGQSSKGDSVGDFYIHNAAGSITTPRLSINSTTGLITGRITEAAIADTINSTLPISKGGTGATTAAAALSALGGAPLASPTFTGTPKVPEPGVNSNDTQIATTAFVISKLSSEIQAANAPTKTGGGAEGTWGISISGTAEVASTVVGGSIVPASLTTTNNTWTLKNKVGVNVNAPAFPLEVTDTTLGRSVGLGESEIKLRGDGYAHWSIYGSRLNKRYFDIQKTSSNAGPGVDGDSYFRILENGNVGLGISNPTRKLEISGTAVATSFIGNLTGNVTGTLTGDITGSSTSCTGNAASVTNGVYRTGNQTIDGIKTFSSVIRLSDAGLMFNSDGAQDTGFTWASDGVMNVRCNAVTVGQFNSTGWTGNAATATVSSSCSGNAITATSASQISSGGLTTNGNQINPGSSGELALTFQNANGSTNNFYNTTIFDGKHNLITRFHGDNGLQYNKGNIIINNSSPTLYLQDAEQRSAMVHVNSNTFYILRGGVNSTTWNNEGVAWPLEINLANNAATFGGNVSAPTFNNIYSLKSGGLDMRSTYDSRGWVNWSRAQSGTKFIYTVTYGGQNSQFVTAMNALEPGHIFPWFISGSLYPGAYKIIEVNIGAGLLKFEVPHTGLPGGWTTANVGSVNSGTGRVAPGLYKDPWNRFVITYSNTVGDGAENDGYLRDATDGMLCYINLKSGYTLPGTEIWRLRAHSDYGNFATNNYFTGLLPTMKRQLDYMGGSDRRNRNNPEWFGNRTYNSANTNDAFAFTTQVVPIAISTAPRYAHFDIEYLNM
jgi:hypothetical protein